MMIIDRLTVKNRTREKYDQAPEFLNKAYLEHQLSKTKQNLGY